MHWSYYKAGLLTKSPGWTTQSFWQDATDNNNFTIIAGPDNESCNQAVSSGQLQIGDVLLRSKYSNFADASNGDLMGSHALLYAPGTYDGKSFEYVNCGGGNGVTGKGRVKGTNTFINRSYAAILRYNKPLPSTGPNIQGAVGVIEKMDKYKSEATIPSGAKITYDDLRYLSIPHYTFSGSTTTGHMVVHKDLAQDVINIFAKLYSIQYPIERMEPIARSPYNNDDYTSIEYNNTSAFNYRESTNGTGKSQHAYGRAIDINPKINPYVKSNGTGAHENAREYWSRDTSKWTNETAKKAYIGNKTQIYNIFKEYGWEWGGDWTDYRDYQHFQKKKKS